MRTNTEQQATVSSRAIVSDDGSTIWLTTHGQDGAVLRVQLSPLRTLGLAGELRSSLRDVEHALSKFERGTYGSCERCGGPIAVERLEAIPWARLCITCKQKRT